MVTWKKILFSLPGLILTVILVFDEQKVMVLIIVSLSLEITLEMYINYLLPCEFSQFKQIISSCWLVKDCYNNWMKTHDLSIDVRFKE